MARVKRQHAWVEAHYRIDDIPPPAGLKDVARGHYTLKGGRIPFSDLRSAADVYSMLQEIDSEFAEFFPRPMGFYDVVCLCRTVGDGNVIPNPLIVVPEHEVGVFALSNAIAARPVSMPSTGTPAVIPGVFAVSIPTPWFSLT